RIDGLDLPPEYFHAARDALLRDPIMNKKLKRRVRLQRAVTISGNLASWAALPAFAYGAWKGWSFFEPYSYAKTDGSYIRYVAPIFGGAVAALLPLLVGIGLSAPVLNNVAQKTIKKIEPLA